MKWFMNFMRTFIFINFIYMINNQRCIAPISCAGFWVTINRDGLFFAIVLSHLWLELQWSCKGAGNTDQEACSHYVTWILLSQLIVFITAFVVNCVIPGNVTYNCCVSFSKLNVKYFSAKVQVMRMKWLVQLCDMISLWTNRSHSLHPLLIIVIVPQIAPGRVWEGTSNEF